MRQASWLSYLIVGVFLAVLVPARLADSQWLRAGLLAFAAAVFLALGIVAVVRRRRASRERIVHDDRTEHLDQ
jgi:sulfite exporter TauE/SafE